MQRLAMIVLALAMGAGPALATTRVMCLDGTWVKSSKSCRYRGGVVEVRHRYGRPAPHARCRDGSVQLGSSHTCRHRGGVAYWL